MATSISQQLRDLAAAQADLETQHARTVAAGRQASLTSQVIRDRLDRAVRAMTNLHGGQQGPAAVALVQLARLTRADVPDGAALGAVLQAALALPGAADRTGATQAVIDAVGRLPAHLRT